MLNEHEMLLRARSSEVSTRRSVDCPPQLLVALLLFGCSAPAETAATAVVETSDAAVVDTAEPPSDASSDDAVGETVATSDAAPETAAPTDTGPASCALCEDFESSELPKAWMVSTPDCSGTGTLALDASVHHGGKQSLKVVGQGGYCNHVFLATSALATLGPQKYVRFFVRIDSALGAGHVTFLAMKDAADGGKNLRMGGQNGVLMYNRESDDATLPTMSPVGVGKSRPLVPETWTCVELHLDETAGTLETWVDGAKIEGLVEDGTKVADVSTQWLSRSWKPSVKDLRLGWESYAGQPMILHFDDVALGSARLGCGP